MNQADEDIELLSTVTAVVRDADQLFERVGGSSRHWVRDCFLPMLNQAGFVVLPSARAEAAEATLRATQEAIEIAVVCARRDCVVNPQYAGGLEPVIRILEAALGSSPAAKKEINE